MPGGEAGEEKCLYQHLWSPQAAGFVNLWQFRDVGRDTRQGWKAEGNLRVSSIMSFVIHRNPLPQIQCIP